MPEHRGAAGIDPGVVRLLCEAEIRAAVAAECLPEEPVRFVHVSGHVDRPAGERRDERDILGRLVRAALVGRVVRGAD